MGHYNSFVIRVWSGGSGRVRGMIEHVGSHSSQAFVDPSVVLDFIRTHLGPPPIDVGEQATTDLMAAREPDDDSPTA